MNHPFSNRAVQQVAPARNHGRKWPRLLLAPLALLIATLLAAGMLALFDQSHIALAAPPNPDTMLYVIASGGKTTGTCLRSTVVISPAHFDYTNACTLDYAIKVADDGDVLALEQGFYNQSVVISESLRLVGGYPTGFSTYPADPVANPTTNQTNLAPSTSTPIITIEGPVTTTLSTNVTLEGLVFRHISGSQERAISLVGPVTPTISGLKISLDVINSTIRDNTMPSGTGGGINVDARIIASLGVSNTTFQTNKGTSGGAIYLSAGSKLFGTSVIFNNSNEATAGNGGAIYANSGAVVNLTNTTIDSNKASVDGGAIYGSNAKLTLSAGTLNNNQATTGSGGAIYAISGTVTFAGTPTPITNNKAAMHGGGIYRANGNLSLTNNNVMTNTATGGSGGGIATTGSGTVTLTGVRFLNNKSGAAGGGAFLGASAVTVASSSEIRNNTAQAGSGGGVYIAATGRVTVTNNTLVRNNLANGNGGGGAFFVSANNATIAGNSLMTNTAAVGGGLYLSGTVLGSLTGNTIQFNKANSNGGGLYLNNNANLSVSGLNLARNTAQVSGGGLYANNSKVTAGDPVSFVLNKATTGSGGGAYLASTSALTATTASFTTNTAQVSGGGLYADQSRFTATTSTTAITNTATTQQGGAFFFTNSRGTLGAAVLLGNTAQTDGGAIYAVAGTILSGTTLVAERNKATAGNGGAFLLQASTVTWSGANTVRYNKANNNGGAVYLTGGGYQVNAGATIISNTVTTFSGGGFYLTANAGFTVTGALDMQENIAKVDGGGIYVDTGRLTLSGGGTVSKNVATTGNGGGINFANQTTATFGAMTFQSNRAQVNGGALRAQASVLTFTADTNVISNTATSGSGGGLHLSVGLTTTFSLKLTLKGNTAAVNGGGIFATDTALSFGNNSEIADNTAQNGAGGGVYLDNGALSTATISFLRNKAKTDGGGLYALNAALTLANASVVRLNQAQTGNGGGIYGGGGKATLTGVTVELNTAQLNGGGVYLTGNPATTELRVQNSSFVRQNKSNTAQGGGLFVTGGLVTIDASTVQSNQAQMGGGGLFQSSGTLTVTNNTQIASNTTITGSGGGLAVLTGTVNVLNSQVNQNSAYGDGGGLYAPGGTVKVLTSTFSGNSILYDTSKLEITTNALAIARGGGIYVDGANIVIDNSTFTNNEAVMGGGGVYAKTLFAHIAGSQLTGNDGGRGGGGAAYLAADLVELLQNNFVQNNTAGNGGALAIEDTDASRIISNTLTGNFVRQDIVITTTVLAQDIVIQQTGQIIKHAGETVTGQDETEGTGGGIHFLRSTGIFTGNVILRNENNSGEGGGLFLSSSTVTMTNNVVAQNAIALSSTYASGIYVINTKLGLRHNTIADNTNNSTEPSTRNVGVYITKSGDEASAVTLTNNIISGHTTGILLLTGNTAGIISNLFFNTDENWGGPIEYAPASGNKVGDPLFVDADNDNYDIQRQSAAFDIGVVTDVKQDIRGTPRLRAFGVDAGAYEQRYLQGVHMRAVASPQFVGSGEQISYKIDVVNHSPGPLSSVSVKITLPSQQSVNSISGPGCSGTTCNLGTMSADQAASITLVTTANGTPPDQGFIEMQTVVNVTVGGPGPTDGTVTLLTRLQRCRIRYNNTDYATLQAAIDAVNTADDLDDIIRVSGYCGGGFKISKKLTIQGGWNFPMTVFNPTLFPTTVNGGGSGRVVEITGDVAPTIENIILMNGSAGGKGGGPSGKDAGGVVYIKDARATLQNVRITGGSAAYGAGLYVDKLTAPIIKDSTIDANQAGERGGGVYAHNSSPELTNVTINNNSAGAGGGVYLYKSEAKIVGCTISNNRATGSGSYLQVAGFNIRFSVGGGGGVNFDESKGSVTNSKLEHNTAKAGGAIFADNSPGAVVGSIINDNEANGSSTIVPIIVLSNSPGGGGAVYAQRSDMVIENNQITHNRSTAAPGGAIHIFNGSADGKINGNFLGYNSAGKGSAVYVQLKPDTFKIFVLPLTIPDFLIPLLLGQPQPDPPKLTMMNNTIAHNSGGSVVNFYGESYGELVGNIFAFNSGTGVVAETQALPYLALIPVPIIFVIPIPFPVFYVPKVEMNYTLFYQNGGDSSSSGVGASVSRQNDISGKDPAFKNDGFHIKRISFAYNAGKNTGVPTDIDGQSRPQADITDMGADEYPAIGVRYVAPGGGDTGAEKCANFANPCGTLQTAIDAARAGDLIKMAGGTYTIMATRDSQVQLGYITKTLTIQGGYYRFTNDNSVTDGLYTANDWEVPFPDTNATILDAGNGGRALFIKDEKLLDSDGNPITVEPTITGVSIKNGNSSGLKGPQGNQFDAGGAIYLDNTKVTITNVDITNSTADYGGAVYMISSTLTLSDVIVKNNTANERGGGFYLQTSNDVSISNIVIESNKAPRGGGLYLERSAANVILNQIRSNGDSNITLEGGGIFLDNSPANIISNTITANNAANGAGFFTFQSDASFVGNTVTNNKALNTGEGNGRGGGCLVGPGSANLQKNIIQGNQAIFGAGCYLNDSSASVRLNQVKQNIATISGGGFYLRNSSGASLQENTVDANKANGKDADNGGGGLFLESSNSTIRSNTVTNNTSNAGGAIYLFSFSNANLQNNTFSNNTATVDGGGAYLKLSDAQLSENTITFNKTAQGNGGGVYIRLSSAQLRSNIIEENSAVLAGGGVYLDQSGVSLELDSVRSNTAKDGAGIYIFRADTAKFTKVGIEQNRASQFGGGVYIRLSSVPFEDQTIANNFAQVAGGGVYIDESAVNFNRNTVRNNEAGQQGGGVAITRRSFAILGSNAVVDNRAGATGSGIYVAGSQPKLIHTTIARNVGGDGTGVVAVTSDGNRSTVSMVNSILANQSVGIRASSGNTVTLSATLWDSNGKDFDLTGGKVLTGSAEFDFHGAARFQADGIHIQKNSKAIGVGLSTEVGRDIDGDGRPQGGGPELGADELLADCLAVVNTNLNTTYTKVQDAINAANPGDEVRISGTCTGAQTQGGTSQLAYIDKQITVRGGYTPTNWLQSYPITQPTFLDAQGQGRVIFVAAGKNATIEALNMAGGDARNMGGGPSGLDAGGIIYVKSASPTLRNLTMTGGAAYYGGGVYLESSTSSLTNSKLEGNQGTKGGGIFLRNSQVTLKNNTLTSNNSTDGAGIFLSFSQSTLEGNTLMLNSATAAGGGIFMESSNATVRSNGIFTNTAQTAGGIYVDGAGPTIARNTINGNTGQNGGGIYFATSTATVNGNQFIANNGGIGAGIYIQAGKPILDNNVVAKNVGQIQASGIYILSSSPTFRHNTVAANTGGDGSGVFITDLGVQPANIEMVNNIFADHTIAISLTAGNKITVRSNLWNNNGKDWAGAGIVDDKGGHVRADPLFVNPDGGDYHLQSASPARDKGASDAGVTIDYDNQDRPADNGFDMGADEFVFTGVQVFIETRPDPVIAGADFQLTVRVVNIGNIDQNAQITVTLPAVMEPSGVLTFTALIKRAETWVKTIDARVLPTFSGVLKINADVTTSANSSASLEANINVNKPDYAIGLIAEASPSPVPAGAQLLYQIRVNNVGNQPLNASLAVVLPDTVSAAAPMNFDPGQLGPGGAWTKSVLTNVAADAEGNLVAVFHATTVEGPTADYTLTVPIAQPSLLTGVSATPDPILSGNQVTYTLMVTNAGNIDFTNIITFVAPVDENGRPLLAPGADQVFKDVAIKAGETWTQVIVAVTLPGYVGPLNSQVLVKTNTGLLIVHDDTRQVISPDRGPTIIAVNSGPWNDPNTWEPQRVPNPDDIAQVNAGVVVTVDAAPNPIQLTGLINNGTILLNCVAGEDMRLEISDFILNPGLIRGRDGQAVGEPGCGISVTTTELNNPGTIRAGDGMDGAVIPPNNDIINGGDGGAMNVFAQSVVNDGTIRAGDGGDLLFPATSGKGGDGGDCLVAAGPPDPGLLLNSGLISAGDGGAGPGKPQGNGSGGDGGSVTAISSSQYINDNGEVRAGLGGDGNGDGIGGGADDGKDGSAIISAAFIWDNGLMVANGTDYAFGTLAKPIVRGVPGATVLLPVTFINSGVRSDNYVLIWANSQGWEQNFLPTLTGNISGLHSKNPVIPFVIPPGTPEGTVSEVQLTARSQGLPALVQIETIRVIVLGAGKIYLPSLFRSDASTSASGQVTPAQPAADHYFLPLIGD